MIPQPDWVWERNTPLLSLIRTFRSLTGYRPYYPPPLSKTCLSPFFGIVPYFLLRATGFDSASGANPGKCGTLTCRVPLPPPLSPRPILIYDTRGEVISDAHCGCDTRMQSGSPAGFYLVRA
jgi:hypothetical protein